MMSEKIYLRAVEDEFIQSLPSGGFSGEIYVVDHPDTLEFARQSLMGQDVLGFDTETKPSFKKGRYHQVALVQISTYNKAFLFRLNHIPLPGFVTALFEDEDVIKVGVALKDDLNGLQKLKPFKPAGFVDLQQFVKPYGIEDNGLKKLVANILGIRISKRFQTSNWEQEILSPEQMQYAATDAWVCRQIYLTLTNHH
jgi:ribonuclease D